MATCYGCVIYKVGGVKECHYRNDGPDCKAIRKALSGIQPASNNKRYATALEVAKEFRAGRPELRSFTVAAFVRHCESRLNGEDTTSHS